MKLVVMATMSALSFAILVLENVTYHSSLK
jgi:hypothetical protein